MRKICFPVVFFLVSAALFAQGSKKVKPTIQYADSLFMQQDWKSAVPVYEAALKQTPENSLAWNRLAASYHNLKQYDKALVNYQKALEYKPNAQLEQVICSRLARIYAEKNDLDMAFSNLEKALQLGYGATGEMENHEEFENLRKDSRYADALKRATSNALPCMGNEQARQFDFWIGEWDAYVTGTAQLAGHSRIEMASGGCMILENWTSAGNYPFSGKSMNFVDPASGKWKQVWIGSAGVNVSEFLNGEYRDNAMRFEFENTNPQGVKTKVHFYFFNQGPDQVRQFHETSADDGKTWVTTYDFTYKRKQ
jgi:hypothetical protein